MTAAGILITVSAPSGAGKTSLVSALHESTENLCVSVSHTTRAMRPGEQDGVNYHFVDETTFNRMIEEEAFLEHAQVFSNSYGTSKKAVTDLLNQGKDVILEIDWQGAQQIRTTMSDCVSVFILPPSLETLKERLHGRGQDEESVIQRRLEEARNEISHYNEADYLVVNDDFDDALVDLKSIVRSIRLKTTRQRKNHQHLIDDLLS
ncbi:MAG: guanylate kinase [bacterium]